MNEPVSPKRRLGFFAKAMAVFVALTFVCLIGALVLIKLDPRPSWYQDANRTFMIGAQTFLILAVAMKGLHLFLDKK